LGAGNDTLTLANGTTSSTAVFDGGTGTNTLVMVGADAAVADNDAVFETFITNFSKLSLVTAGTTAVVNLANLDDISYVISNGATSLTLQNMTNAGTLELTDTNTATIVTMTDAADSLTIALNATANKNVGTVTASGVETIAITTADAETGTQTANVYTLALTDTAAKTINISGSQALVLTSANTAVTVVNASGLTAALTYTTAGTTAQSVTGGTGADSLTAAAGTVADTLVGGAGNDTLTNNAALTILTGGTGKDTFVIKTAGANANTYNTITDLASGDKLHFSTGVANTFTTAKLTSGDTAVFQTYADIAAVNSTAANDSLISWFQFAGNTYVVQDMSDSASFVNGTDIAVRITGLVDLSTASFNTVTGTIVVA